MASDRSLSECLRVMRGAMCECPQGVGHCYGCSTIDRALEAAEQRGREEERERCAGMMDAAAKANRSHLTKGIAVTVGAIRAEAFNEAAAAIRKGAP